MPVLEIELPEQYSPPTLINLSRYFSDLLAFLTSPLIASIFCSHPNDVALDGFEIPDIWSEWWEWAGSDIIKGESAWKLLVEKASGTERS